MADNNDEVIEKWLAIPPSEEVNVSLSREQYDMLFTSLLRLAHSVRLVEKIVQSQAKGLPVSSQDASALGVWNTGCIETIVSFTDAIMKKATLDGD